MSKRSEQLDRNWEVARADLVDAANKAGIDPAIMARMAGLESAFNATARPVSRDASQNTVAQYDGVKAMSSAHGYGQLGGSHLFALTGACGCNGAAPSLRGRKCAASKALALSV